VPSRVRRSAPALALGIGLVALFVANLARDSHTFRPERHAVTDALIGRLRAPPGFRVEVFARDLGNPRMLLVGDDGGVYVTRPATNDVLVLRDGQPPRPILSGLEAAHGLVIHERTLYVAGLRQVVAAELRPPGELGPWRTVIGDLPHDAGHGLRTLGFGPDGMLYISIGSTCNACPERNPEHATILRADADGRGRRIFARGLRNTMAFGWHPETGEMWGVDNGSDHRGDDQPPEELNRLVDGADYGWPFCFGDRQPDPKVKGADCGRTVGMTLGYQAHAAPIWMLFYTGTQFPAEYGGDAFVAFHGSWNRRPASGYRVVRIKFIHGRPERFEDFVTGFLIDDGRAQFGRPAGLALMRDGSLLMSDDSNGMLYRVRYSGGG
jgi:glucose/arabinose dehydrogenase